MKMPTGKPKACYCNGFLCYVCGFDSRLAHHIKADADFSIRFLYIQQKKSASSHWSDADFYIAYAPVEPKPPLPRWVWDRVSTTVNMGVSTGVITSCATRSPWQMVWGLLP